MKYIILPNSVPELLKEQNEEFIQLQNVYRKKLEEYLNKYVDFHDIDL